MRIIRSKTGPVIETERGTAHADVIDELDDLFVSGVLAPEPALKPAAPPEPPAPPLRAERPEGNRRRGVIVFVAMAVALASGLGYGLTQLGGQQPHRNVTPNVPAKPAPAPATGSVKVWPLQGTWPTSQPTLQRGSVANSHPATATAPKAVSAPAAGTSENTVVVRQPSTSRNPGTAPQTQTQPQTQAQPKGDTGAQTAAPPAPPAAAPAPAPAPAASSSSPPPQTQPSSQPSPAPSDTGTAAGTSTGGSTTGTGADPQQGADGSCPAGYYPYGDGTCHPYNG